MKSNGTHTFISAFKSSPVHCLKPRPCGKRLRPAKGATIAILSKVEPELDNNRNEI
jgi:hypothetical protein